MKKLETLVAVHTYTHTHTHGSFSEIIKNVKYSAVACIAIGLLGYINLGNKSEILECFNFKI